MAARAANDATLRRAQLSAIHVAKGQLQLDDGTYRDLIERVSATCGTGVRSAADLTPKQRRAVLDELRQLGAAAPKRTSDRAARGYPGKPHNFAQLPAMITKIEAQLADMGLSWAYADAIAKRMHRVERVAWLQTEPQLRDIIAALDVEQQKRDIGAEVNQISATLGFTDAEIAARINGLASNWRRRLPQLKAVRLWLAGQLQVAVDTATA